MLLQVGRALVQRPIQQQLIVRADAIGSNARIRTLSVVPGRRPPAPSKDEKPQTFTFKGDASEERKADGGDGSEVRKPVSRERMVLDAIDKKNMKRTISKSSALAPSKVTQKTPPVEKLVEKYRVNKEIVGVTEATLVGPSGSMGKLPFAKIEEEAAKLKLDMVEVASQPEVVIKLMDFEAFVEEKRRARKQREALMGTQPKDLEEPLLPLKEIQIGTNIEHHDFEMKKDVMKRFLEKKHPVKLVIKMKRSSSLRNEPGPQKANELINRVLSDLSDVLALEKTKHDPKPAPGSIVKFFYPKTISPSSSGTKIAKPAQTSSTLATPAAAPSNPSSLATAASQSATSTSPPATSSRPAFGTKSSAATTSDFPSSAKSSAIRRPSLQTPK